MQIYLHFSLNFLLIIIAIIIETLYFRGMNDDKKSKKNNSPRLVVVDPLNIYREKLEKIRGELIEDPREWMPKGAIVPLMNETNFLTPTIKLSIDTLYKTLFPEL